MSKSKFIHLRTHTEHSLLEGAVPLKSLIKLCVKQQMPAVAVTDTNNLFAALEFSVSAKEAGVQPIIGCQISLAYDPVPLGAQPRPPAPIVLLAQDEAGYMNLMKLNSALYIGKGGQLPQVTMDELAAHSAGLICLTGGSDGPLGRLIRAGQMPRADDHLRALAAAFPQRLYVELQRHPTAKALPQAEAQTEAPMLDMAYAMGLPIVATNDVYFPDTKMYEAHDALICIAEGAYVDQQTPRRRLTPQHYFKTEAEMATLFADLPEALDNTVEIAHRCAFAAYKRKPILPRFARGNGPMVADQSATEAEADQDWCPRHPPCPRHHLLAGRGGRHQPDGARHPCRHPPIEGATAIPMTALHAQNKRKRQDRSARRAEKRRCWNRMLRVHRIIRQDPSVWATTDIALGGK